jgi:hypothetical protein
MKSENCEIFLMKYSKRNIENVLKYCHFKNYSAEEKREKLKLYSLLRHHQHERCSLEISKLHCLQLLSLLVNLIHCLLYQGIRFRKLGKLHD